mgnify:CR=1 FL=1
MRLRNAFAVGSSPRVRGKPGQGSGRSADQRLIPACAGKTQASGGPTSSDGAHPRVCGENGCRVLRHRTSPWLIPACAGKTCPAPTPAQPTTAHPRVCGENGFHRGWSLGVSGSSPRVRGKHDPVVDLVPRQRLIPACAGKTTRPSAPSPTSAAHPRVCGENSSSCSCHGRRPGSSPRVRGKRRCRERRGTPPRLIPACAGKTLFLHRFRWNSGAHPRVCGENPLSHTNSPSHHNSSPRVRGKPSPRACPATCTGLIPACAGKTRVYARVAETPGAHPRVCGENEHVFAGQR